MSNSNTNSREKKKKAIPSKMLFRSRDNYMLAGVIGGLAEYWSKDATILRILFLALAILTAGIAMIIYFILVKVIPLEPIIE